MRRLSVKLIVVQKLVYTLNFRTTPSCDPMPDLTKVWLKNGLVRG